MKTATQKLVREINALTVLNIIREYEPISRADIVKMSNLAFPTVMRIGDVFIQKGLVIETIRGESGVGRKPILLCLNKEAFYVVGAAIHSHLEVWLLDIQSNVITKWSECVRPGEQSCKAQVERVAYLINLLVDNSGISKDKIAGVGIGMPGTDFKADSSIAGSRFQGWEKDIDVKTIIEEKTGISTYVNNISRTYTNAELYYGWGKTYADFVCVMVDFGVSGCQVVNSEIMNGENNVAGELGHVSIDPFHGRHCYCGNKGCIESYISREGILQTLKERLDSSSVLFGELKGDFTNLTFEKAVKAIQYDEMVLSVFREAGRLLGHFLVNIVNILDPGVIVLGGSVVTSCQELYEEAKAVVYENVFSNKARDVKILCSFLPEAQCRLGAAIQVTMNALGEYSHYESK